MQVHALLLADSVQAVDGKLYMLGGAWSVLHVVSFPTTHLLGIGLAVDVGWNDTNVRHKAEIFVEDADGNAYEAPRVEFEFETGRPPGHPAGADQRFVFAFNGGIQIERPGSLAVVAKIGGNEVGRSRFLAIPKK